MENSLGSSADKGVASKDDPEESGWTSYFKDFSSKQRYDLEEEEENTPSLVSDAASCVPLKINMPNNNQLSLAPPIEHSHIMPNKFNFKKTRTREISHHDDSLEDTASSLVNSPKVSSLKLTDMINPRKKEDNIESSLGKGGGPDFCSELDREEGNEMIFEGNDNYYWIYTIE
ncbi:Methyltransferase-like protein [Actinidia chinensis var. chinensis]|uniref:Methyltransferase-like protein n=1 Tax=Actinidia chinensis var. chinensis TaxID=1590841 RepID=A0A2R6QWM4_ACTCC|nr:Methyltransferase-like protein [Actinidia chinensis var. chinensis]